MRPLLLVAASAMLAAQESYAPLFNGRDLTGWVNINCAPQTFTASDRFRSRRELRAAGAAQFANIFIRELK